MPGHLKLFQQTYSTERVGHQAPNRDEQMHKKPLEDNSRVLTYYYISLTYRYPDGTVVQFGYGSNHIQNHFHTALVLTTHHPILLLGKE